MIKTLSIICVLLLVGMVTVTYTALESGDVLVVETQPGDGAEARKTHVWFVEEAGAVFLEAGHTDNPWVRDLAWASTLKLSGEGLDGEYNFTIHEDPDNHRRIRSLMRSKYGWRDRWIYLLFNVSESRLVQIRDLDKS
jgi:hypothetical protein